MTISLGSLSSLQTAITPFSNVLLVVPQTINSLSKSNLPQNTIGYQPQNVPATANGSVAALQKAFVFHYEGEQSVSLESDITDHYVEDNTAVQDQIALRPVMISTHGFIGELNNVPPGYLAIAQNIVSKLTSISSYLPSLTVTALDAYNTAFQVYQAAQNVANSAIQTANSLGASVPGVGPNGGNNTGEAVVNGQVIGNTGLYTQNRQQTAFQYFFTAWINRYQFTVQTPWAVFQNMAIKSLRSVQDAETNMITDFQITFKAIQLVASISTNVYADRLAAQAAVPVSTGQGLANTPTDLGTSISDNYGTQFPNSSLT